MRTYSLKSICNEQNIAWDSKTHSLIAKEHFQMSSRADRNLPFPEMAERDVGWKVIIFNETDKLCFYGVKTHWQYKV